MLSELDGLQESDEDVWSIDLSFDIETRKENEGRIIQRKYTFRYNPEWDKWSFHEFHEKKTGKMDDITERNWKEARHLTWDDVEVPQIDIPPEVSDALAEATGAENVTIQVPSGTVNEYIEAYTSEDDG